ncbi:hypothetical protein A2W14_00450 [Candidatus Gottesmanbacteria bacterium RBG_16_37_8]|uniref:histidine kinase n=1 Tax=Candidatus Gottesmanbacteria bacterium RBG_16_37_8 TaxID=1798371 RepID=A0A1F5YQJ4_9BACT|nr:MAG: hypothetical protein A2W14_00450 [Candidatus Gottesmanbacteria bacterium RBG_16_37_8]
MSLKVKIILFSTIISALTIIAVQLLFFSGINNLISPVFITIIGILILLVIYWIAVDLIFQKLIYLIEIAQTIANGNLNVRLKKSYLGRDDEIGIVSRAFYFMLLKIRQTLNSLEDKVRIRTEELANAKATDEAMLTSIADAVTAVDKNGNIIFINDKAEMMFSWEKQEVIGKNILSVWQLKIDVNKEVNFENHPILMALSGHKIFLTMKDNYWCYRDNNVPFPVNVSVSPIFLDQKIIGAIIITRDITDDKKIDKAKTEFVSLASHQLRTPLSAINWFVEMINSGETGEINQTQKKYLEIIQNTSKRMSELVNSLLNVTRIELGNFSIEPQPYDIISLAKMTITELQPEINGKNIIIEQDFDTTLNHIPIDIKLTTMIFQNLLSNAIKYSYQNGKIKFSIKKMNIDIYIIVEDNGIGIPKNDHAKIFSKFYRASNTTKIRSEGTGLGLYIIKNIIEQIQGKIWFTSEDNKGSTFYITFPVSGMIKREGQKKLS